MTRQGSPVGALGNSTHRSGMLVEGNDEVQAAGIRPHSISQPWLGSGIEVTGSESGDSGEKHFAFPPLFPSDYSGAESPHITTPPPIGPNGWDSDIRSSYNSPHPTPLHHKTEPVPSAFTHTHETAYNTMPLLCHSTAAVVVVVVGVVQR